MGYTCYFSDYVCKEETFGEFLEEAKKILKAFEIEECATWDEAVNRAAAGEDEFAEDLYSGKRRLKDYCSWYLDPKWKDIVNQLEESDKNKDDDVLAFFVIGPHEWLCLPDKGYNGKAFTFTKTARKCYDPMIKILYGVAQQFFGGEISHDGPDDTYYRECFEYAHPDDVNVAEKLLYDYNLEDN
jgi:hypothetical protein